MDEFFLEEDFSDSDSLGIGLASPSSPNLRLKTPFSDKSFEPLINQLSFLNATTSLPRISYKKLPKLIRKHKKKFTFKLLNNNQIIVFSLLPVIENQKNDCYQTHSSYMSWTQIENTTNSLLTTVILSKIKEGYQNISSRFSLVSCDQHSHHLEQYIEDVSKQDLFSSNFFHFIAYGHSKITDSTISTISSTTEQISIPMESLFRSLGPSSFSIFDGNNSGRALSVFLSLVQKDSAETTITKGKFLFSDCFCLCSASENEEMPSNQCLPRDFLTSVLLTPVRMALLCHINHNYKDMMNKIGTVIKDIESCDFATMFNNEINAVAECVASESISNELFIALFRKDEHIAVLFRRFILCQFLLDDYNVHPVSYPELPQMQKHRAWAQLSYSIDQWLISRVSPSPVAENDLFHRVIYSFFKNFHEKQDHSVVAIVALMPGLFNSAGELLAPLAYFASLSEENRKTIIPILHFGKIFQILFHQHVSLQLYHACSYIILSADISGSEFNILLTEQMNIARFQEIIMTKTYPPSTRAILTAILSKLVDSYQPAHNLCITSAFFSSYGKILKDTETQPLIWLLILLKRVWRSYSIDQINFIEDNIHLQIASLIFHKSYEVRAAAMTTISVFMQTSEQALNKQLFLLMIPAATDMSYLVRYQFLMFVIRFIASRRTVPTLTDTSLPPLTLSQFLDNFYGTTKHFSQIFASFKLLEKITFDAANSPNANNKIIAIALFLLEYFTHDPCPLIQETATKARDLFNSKEKRRIAPPFNSSIQRPADIPSISNTKGVIYDFPSDSDVIFSYAYEQLSEAGQWNSEITQETHTRKRMHSTIDDYDDCGYLPSKVVLKKQKRLNEKHIEKICFYPESNTLVCAHSSKMLLRLDDGLITGSTLTMNSNICDLTTKSIGNATFVICSTIDGCVHLCDMEKSEEITSFRANFNTKPQNTPQFIAPLSYSPRIATARGSSGVSLWDIETQKVIGEWKTPDVYNISTLAIHKSDENLCVCGLTNGSLTPIDFRTQQNNTPSKLLNVSVSDKVVHITSFNANDQVLYAGISSGTLMSWDIRGDQVIPICQRRGPLVSFDAQPNFPMFMYSSANDRPLLLTPSGQVLASLDSVGYGAMVAPHQSKNLTAFADVSGNIQLFDIEK